MVGYTASKWCKPGFKSNNLIPLEMSTTPLCCVPKTNIEEQEHRNIPEVLTLKTKTSKGTKTENKIWYELPSNQFLKKKVRNQPQ